MTMMKCLLFTAVLLTWTCYHTEGALHDILERCCGIGLQWFIQSREKCDAYPTPIRNIADASDQMSCSAVIQVCCLHQRQQKQCKQGKQFAHIKRNCAGLHNQIGNENTRECCNCCKLGLVAATAGVSCELSTKFSLTCSKVFQECCDGDSQSNQPVTIAPITQPPNYREDRCQVNNPCQHRCEDTGVAIDCSCFDGYTLHIDGKACADINECVVGTHNCAQSQTCVNHPGSFSCENTNNNGGDDTENPVCADGYAFNRLSRRCEDVDECIVGHHNCPIHQICVNTQGSFICDDDSVTTDCGVGFAFNRITKQCDDLDECLAGSHRCHGPHQVCRNTIGSHHCMCDIGFTYDVQSRQCQDINECALNQDSCLEGQHCENTLGSYHCRRSISCGTGYTLDRNSQQCVDDDECHLGTHNCGVTRACRNTLGSFRCEDKTCPLGFKLNFNTGQCIAVVCGRGLKPDRAGNCVDVNECVDRPNACSQTQECRNTIGSFICHNLINCGPGFELNEAGNQCNDINECETGTHNCLGHLQTCLNRHGTYLCQCPEGYQMNHSLRQCEDRNECERFGGQVCSQNSVCENTPGSFRCSCKEGFESDLGGKFCKDIDECASEARCDQSCRNTWGSYQCTCREGYQLDEDLRSCVDIDECELWSDRGRLCVGVCENTLGSYTCSCPDGYRMLGDSRTCQDIDECAIRTANCHGPNDICVNTRGGYKCENVVCPNGFVRVPSQGNRNRWQQANPWTTEKRVQNKHGVGSILGRPPVYYNQDETGVACQRLECQLNDIPCLLNKTKSIQWQHVALPTMPFIREPMIILNVKTKGRSIYPNVHFTIESGNDNGYFDVSSSQRTSPTGSLRLLKPIFGPRTCEVKLRMDNRNSFNYIVSSHYAYIYVYVSRYKF